uniref:beta strand repeat-containing protein n=1 Tax=Methanomethylovorans sp. TaxID=2758717 RepID=UPI00351C5BC0
TDIIINDTTPYTIGVGDTLTIGVGDTLTIENGGTLTIEEGGTLTIEDGGYIDNGGRINNYGTIDNSGQIDNNNKDGEIYHDNGGTIDNYGEIYNNEGGTIDNDGWIDNYGTIENDGIIDNSGLIYNDYGGTIYNDGEIYNNEGGTIDNYGELDNYGTINNKGFLYCDVGTIYNDYSGTIDNYGTIYNDYGTIENYGEIYNNEGGTLKNYGTIENYGDSIHNYGTIANAGTIDNYGTFANYAGGTIENAGIINIFSGTLTGEGSISGEGSINDYTTVEPVADAGGPYSAVEGSEIIFNASKSYDPDGVYLEYRWDFESNGTWTTWSTEPAATHTWNDDWTGTVTLEVSDGELNNTSIANVTVTNADPVVDAGDDQTINEGDTATFSGSFTDAGTADTHTIAWDFGDGSTADTLDTSHTYDDSGTYTVNLTVTDDDGGVGNDSLTVTVNTVNSAPVANAGGPYEAVEGSAITFDASVSSDPDAGDTLQYRWDFESDGTWDTELSTDPKAGHTWTDDWTGTATLEVNDGELNNTSTAAVIVTNAAPVLGAIVTPTGSFRVNTLVSVSGIFSDPGILDTHTAVWNWGDGTTDTGIVNENNGAGTVTGEHSYNTAGTYWVTLNVTDDDGGSANVTSQQYVVVYNPSAGYVTGAGWIQSPAGAYASVPSFAGKGTLKISAKYAKGAALPSMTTEFIISSKTVNMNFRSTSYDWIVINGAYAKYTGSGTINKAGNYGYMVSAVDGGIAGDGIDKFRIKIWDKASGEIVYDNEMGTPDDTEPSNAIGSGSIVIHNIQ